MTLPTLRSRGLAATALILTLGLALAGCGTAPPGAGLTNGPRPESADEKPAVRTDLPVDATPDTGELLGKTGDAETSGGSAARGGEGDPDQPQPAKGDESVRANPPAIDSATPGSAAGADTPVDNINTGTPRSPQ